MAAAPAGPMYTTSLSQLLVQTAEFFLTVSDHGGDVPLRTVSGAVIACIIDLRQLQQEWDLTTWYNNEANNNEANHNASMHELAEYREEMWARLNVRSRELFATAITSLLKGGVEDVGDDSAVVDPRVMYMYLHAIALCETSDEAMPSLTQ